MNGQYLMNKEISVQYAYKKDGKGERHGDQAERMLAAQARKHNVQPTSQALPVALFSGVTPSVPATMLDMENNRAGGISQNNAPGFMNGRAHLNGGFQAVTSIQTSRPAPTPQPLPAPPSGLPARPPPSQAGYGGPQGFLPPGFSPQQPQGFPPSSAGPPPGFGQPSGFGPPPGHGPPPGMPPGFQSQNFARAR
jgi:splicing factor 3B subunit 4